MRIAALISVLCLASLAWAVRIAPDPDVIPADGAVVGRNAKIWVFDTSSFVQLTSARLGTVDASGATIAAAPLGGITKLTPTAPLEPGTYQLTSGRVLSTFTVTADDDTTPPPAPNATVSTTGKVGSVVSTVVVSAPASKDAFLVVMGEPQQWEPASIYAAGAKGSATVMDLSAGKHTLKVVQVDASGNASEPVMLDVDVPKDRACSVAPVLPLSLLAVMLLRRARRT